LKRTKKITSNYNLNKTQKKIREQKNINLNIEQKTSIQIKKNIISSKEQKTGA